MKIESRGDKGGSTFSAPKSNDSAHQDQQGQGFIPGKTDDLPADTLQTRVPTAQDISQDTTRNQARTPLPGETDPIAVPPRHAGNNLGNVQGGDSQNRAVYSYQDPGSAAGASISVEREPDGRLLIRAQGGVAQGGHVVLIPMPAAEFLRMRDAMASA